VYGVIEEVHFILVSKEKKEKNEIEGGGETRKET
jgi:hypothetical protein